MLIRRLALVLCTLSALLLLVACPVSQPAGIDPPGDNGAESLNDVESYAPGRTGEVRTSLVVLPGESEPAMVTYEVFDGLAIFEGDIVLGEVDGLTTEAIAISGSGVRWPNALVPYTVDSDFSNAMKTRIDQAVTHWNDHTNLTLVLRTDESDYVHFTTGEGCSAAVGRKTGKQHIRLLDGGPGELRCGLGAVIHEIGHAIGLWHEQSRGDRNTFVEIVLENVETDKEHNFDQHVNDGTDVGDYDHDSVMHYSATAFGKVDADGNKLTTIRTIPPGIAIGQRSGLSASDIEAANRLYPLQATPYLVVERPSVEFPDENDALTFSATVVDDIGIDLGNYSLTWSFDRWDGVPFFFGSTAHGEATNPRSWCDGTYTVDVSASNSQTGSVASGSVTFTVANADPKPPACDWSIEIVDPEDGRIFVDGETVRLRAVIADDHPETDAPLSPVIWRDGGPTGTIIQQPDILDFTRDKWGVGVHDIHVQYGHVSDQVSFEIIETENTPPTANITSPEDGATVMYQDYEHDSSAMYLPVTGTGQDAEDGSLASGSLTWSFRQQGSANWIAAGEGTTNTIVLPYSSISPNAYIELRLEVEDSEGLRGTEVITIYVMGIVG